MSWLGTVTESDKILTDARYVEVEMFISLGTAVIGSLTRTDTIYTYVWRGLDGTAATDWAGTMAAGTNVEDVQVQRVDDSGQYIVQSTEITEGSFA